MWELGQADPRGRLTEVRQLGFDFRRFLGMALLSVAGVFGRAAELEFALADDGSQIHWRALRRQRGFQGIAGSFGRLAGRDRRR